MLSRFNSSSRVLNKSSRCWGRSNLMSKGVGALCQDFTNTTIINHAKYYTLDLQVHLLFTTPLKVQTGWQQLNVLDTYSWYEQDVFHGNIWHCIYPATHPPPPPPLRYFSEQEENNAGGHLTWRSSECERVTRSLAAACSAGATVHPHWQSGILASSPGGKRKAKGFRAASFIYHKRQRRLLRQTEIIVTYIFFSSAMPLLFSAVNSWGLQHRNKTLFIFQYIHSGSAYKRFLQLVIFFTKQEISVLQSFHQKSLAGRSKTSVHRYSAAPKQNMWKWESLVELWESFSFHCDI